jgi:hypothetical protein
MNKSSAFSLYLPSAKGKGVPRTIKTLFLLLFFVGPLAAQGVDIRGIVADSATGERIPFANVVILNTNRGAASNVQGFYLISNLAPGRYEVTASSVGYGTRKKEITLRPGAAITVNFQLPAMPVQISGVEITGRAKSELSEIQTSVHILEQRDIRSVPTAVQADIFRSIGILPGIVSTSDVTSQFYVRGGAGDQNLILLDGIKIYNPFHAFGLFSVFDPDLIKTTEVYTGAFPAEYGGRLSSVVNMTTKDGNSNGISGRASINFLSTKLELDGPSVEYTTWLISARKSLFSETFRKFLNKDTPLSFYDAFFKATWQPEEGNGKYSIEWFVSDDKMNSQSPSDPDYAWHTNALAMVMSNLIQERLFVNVVWYGNTYTAERNPKSASTMNSMSTTVREVGLRVNGTIYTDSRDLFLLGFEFSFPTLEDKLVNNAGGHVNYYGDIPEADLWTHYQVAMGALKTDLGLHLDIGSMLQREAKLQTFQPRLNFSYPVWETWKAKLAYGRFTQNIITLNNEDDIISIFEMWVQLSESLKPEQADHYVFELEGQPLRNLSVSFQTYLKKYGSIVLYNRNKIDSQDPDYINGTGSAHGFEWLFRYGTQTLDLYAAYSLGWTSVSTGDFTYSPRYDRRHTLNTLLTYRPLEGLDLGLRWQFGSGLPYTQSVGYYDRLSLGNMFNSPWISENEKPFIMLGEKNVARLPAYHRLDASADYRFALSRFKGAVGLSIVNVYNHKNIFYFDRKTGQQVDMLPFFPTATLTLEF